MVADHHRAGFDGGGGGFDQEPESGAHLAAGDVSRSPSRMEASAFSIMRAAFCGARADLRSRFITSFMGRRFLRRSSLPHAELWGCSPA